MANASLSGWPGRPDLYFMRRSKTLGRGFAWVAAIVALQAIVYQFRIGGEAGVEAFGDLVTLPVTALACRWCIRARTSYSGQERTGWLLLGLACASWGAGEAVWTVYELGLGREVPFPSPADIGFLAMLPFAAVAVLLIGGTAMRTTTRVRTLLDGAIIAGSVLFISWAEVLGPTVATSSDTLLEQSIGVAYPLGDVVIIAIVLFCLHRTRRVRSPLGVVGAGLIMIAVADSGFLFESLKGTYTTGALIDLGWTAGFGLIALAALQRPDPTDEAAQDGGERARAIIPIGAMMTAIVAAVAAYASHHFGSFLWYNGIAVVVLQLVSQTITALDNLSLRRGLEAKVAERTAELDAAMRKMGEARRLQDQFVAQVSHELRTPLTTMIGASSTLMRPELDASPTVRLLAEVASRGAQRMSRLVENLLIASALSDRIDSMRVPFDVKSAIDATCNEHRPERKHLYVDVSDGLCALGDPERVRVVVRELLENTAKFAPDFSGVWIKAFPRGETVEIVVSDEGPGIGHDLAERIFERFFQADSSATREREGAGLGLYIARRVAESMGGSLALDPDAGAGATFRLTLPAWARDEADPRRPEPAMSPRRPEPAMSTV